MLAAEVAIFGMFDPSVKNIQLDYVFFVATLYQVWWDVFMDWGLLEWNEDEVTYRYYHSKSSGGDGGGRKGLFWWWPYKLRSTSLPPSMDLLHHFIINFCLRFVGMLTLYHRYTSLDGRVVCWVDGSICGDFRRTIWALLRLEWEVIKTSPSPLMSGKNEDETKGEVDDLLDLLEEETDMKPMAISSSSSDGDRGGRLGFLTSNERRSRISFGSLSDMSNLNGIQILSELCAWATIFSGIAIIAAAHREIL
ncbi:hypothetical protein QTG54_008389 [Skeletonema marinoi]|uniref:EXS domain-containing protein n=1 Tax=Skeletonema marinoi TaxID=267567 RepID=A0AAD8Y7W6_9STRA|nr:hypothetical protein QTG54_008389 [Skeletonema marinoi]